MHVSSHPNVTDEVLAFLLRLLRANPVAISASGLGDDADLVPDLQSAGWVTVLDEDDDHSEPRVSLSSIFAHKAGYAWSETTSAWETVGDILKETTDAKGRDEKRKRVRLINETDYIAGAKRRGEDSTSPVGDGVAAPDQLPFSNGKWNQPTLWIGTSQIWDGPDIGNISGRDDRSCVICSASNSVEMADGSGCLKCMRFAGEKIKRAKSKKQRKAS